MQKMLRANVIESVKYSSEDLKIYIRFNYWNIL